MTNFEEALLFNEEVYGRNLPREQLNDRLHLTENFWERLIVSDIYSLDIGNYTANILTGFTAGLYIKHETGSLSSPATDVVIAYRGSNEAQDWLSNNVNLLGNILPPQANDAEAFYKHVINQVLIGNNIDPTTVNISFTGHSLGGALAQYMGAITGLEAKTFNPAGMAGILLPILLDSSVRQTYIDNYLVQGDPASPILVQYGTNHSTIESHSGNPIEIHNIPITQGALSASDFTSVEGTPIPTDGRYFEGTTREAVGDLLVGTSNNDFFQGDAGDDTLYGGRGNDIYVYKSGDGYDTVKDGALSVAA